MEKEVTITITDYDGTAGDDDGRAVAWETGLPDAADLPPLSQFLISPELASARAVAWETGLPDAADLPPLSQFLISPELASAFNISPEPHRSMTDVTRASHKTLSTLRSHPKHHLLDKVNDNYNDNDNRSCSDDDKAEEMVVEGEETVDLTPEGSDSRKLRRVDSGGSDESSVKTSKRSRLVWTPELHRRFVEVVAHLGVKNAVPKTIMQLMNVEGLTRENVASHLQKYRLYVKRMQGLSNEGSSDSDHVFGSTAVSRVPIPVQYPPEMVNMPYATTSGGGREYYYHGFGHQSHYSHPYSMMMQPKDWYGNNFGFVTRYQHDMTSNEN